MTTTVRSIAEQIHTHIQGLPLAHALRLTARVRDTVQAVAQESQLTAEALQDECVRHVSTVIRDELPSISRGHVAQLASVMVGMVRAIEAPGVTALGAGDAGDDDSDLADIAKLRSPESEDDDGESDDQRGFSTELRR